MGVTIKNVKVDLRGINGEIKKITNHRKAGLFVATTFARYMNKYVPMDTGMLAQNLFIQPFSVTYNQPYASEVYEGTKLNFSKEKHPLATAHWDKACVAANGNVMKKEITEYLKRMRE